MCDIIERNRQEAIKENTITSLKKLTKNMKLTAKQAMDALDIPESEQATYANAL